jgi:GTPase Era involved in 16S rRNA processing
MSSPSVNLNSAGPQAKQAAEALRRYEQLKSEIAAIGQASLQICRELKDTEAERPYQSLLARIAEDRFNLAVLGAFNRGKSTLMNAILGMDRLPTGVLPHTSVITTVTYGSRERILIRCAGWSFPQEVPLERLAEYVTEHGNPGNRQQVILAEIQLPSEILRRGFHFIDTPGVGSGILANTAATERFIPEVDAAIFVSSFEAPFGQDELDFLRRVHREVGKVFIVLNKQDLLPEKERNEIIRFVNQRLDSQLGPSNYTLFPLSSRHALDAKLRSHADGLAQSGLPQLEVAIGDFLSTQKTVQFCSRTLDRLEALLKRQQAELAISLATSSGNGSVAKLRDQFKREVSRLAEHASGTVTRLRAKVSAEIAQELRASLDGFFSELAERARRKFLSHLTARHVLYHRSQNERLLNHTAAFCERSIGEWLRAAASLTIRPAIEKIGGETLRDLMRLPEAVPALAAELVGAGIQVSGKTLVQRDDDSAIECDLILPRLSPAPWHRRPPLWLCFVPLPWLEAAVASWFNEICSAALAEYRRQLETLIRVAAEDYIDTIDREVHRKITERGERIAGYIGSEQQSSKAAAIGELLQRTDRLREQLDGAASPWSARPDGRLPKQENESCPEADTALSEAPCPICERTVEVLFAFLSKHQYVISASEAAQSSHAAKGGFCALHTWMYCEMTSPQGICRAYPGLLTSLSQRLSKRAQPGSGADDLEAMLRRILRQAEDCPACSVVAAVEREVAAAMVSRYSHATIVPVELPVLCLAHLHTALAASPHDDLACALTQRTAQALERSADNMRRYALKHDAIRRDLVSHEERIAYLLGLARVARDKRLAPRWAKDEL